MAFVQNNLHNSLKFQHNNDEWSKSPVLITSALLTKKKITSALLILTSCELLPSQLNGAWWACHGDNSMGT